MDIYLILENQLALMHVALCTCEPHMKEMLLKQIDLTDERLASWEPQPRRATQ
jgi:hypothetical protein